MTIPFRSVVLSAQRLLDNIVGPDIAGMERLELMPPQQPTGSLLVDKLYSEGCEHSKCVDAIMVAGGRNGTILER
jgi:hypothetical protein